MIPGFAAAAQIMSRLLFGGHLKTLRSFFHQRQYKLVAKQFAAT
jgi:hypothetical protein